MLVIAKRMEKDMADWLDYLAGSLPAAALARSPRVLDARTV